MIPCKPIRVSCRNYGDLENLKKGSSKKEDAKSLRLNEKSFTPPHRNLSFHQHVTPTSIKEINSKNTDYKMKKTKKKQKRERRGKEEVYQRQHLSPTIPYHPPPLISTSLMLQS